MQFIVIMQVYINASKNNHLEGFEHSIHVDLTPIFGQRRNAQAGIGFSMVLKKINIDPACQAAQTVFCTPHIPRIFHAELIPMQLQRSPRYVVHHLQDNALTGSVSWPARRYCIGYLNSLGRLLPPVHLDTNDLFSVVRTVQFDGCMFYIRQILQGNATPTIPHKLRHLKVSAFQYGIADAATVDGGRGSNV